MNIKPPPQRVGVSSFDAFDQQASATPAQHAAEQDAMEQMRRTYQRMSIRLGNAECNIFRPRGANTVVVNGFLTVPQLEALYWLMSQSPEAIEFNGLPQEETPHAQQ